MFAAVVNVPCIDVIIFDVPLKGETEMSELTFRSLYPEDINQVSKIESNLTGGQRRDFLEKRLVAATAVPDSFITCAALDGERLTAYGFARILEGEFGARSAVAVLDTIGVDPDHQGKGIGKKIMSGIERRMKNKNISTLQTQVAWTNHAMIRFFASTGFMLATGQVIERDTSPMCKAVAEVAAVKMDGKWQVHSADNGNYCGAKYFSGCRPCRVLSDRHRSSGNIQRAIFPPGLHHQNDKQHFFHFGKHRDAGCGIGSVSAVCLFRKSG